MRLCTFWTFATFVIVAFVVPDVAAASLPFWGPIIPDAYNVCAANWGLVIEVINRIIQLGITLALVIVAPLMIALAGFEIILNPTNPNKREQAKGRLFNVIAGIVIALSAWMIVSALMAVLYRPDPNAGFAARWSDIIRANPGTECIKLKASLNQTKYDQLVTGVSADGTQYGAGSCTPPSSGPCSIASLQQSCFGSNASPAGQICSKESGGNPNNLSRTDITSDGNAYSVGLFQINLTNSFSQQINGRNCSAAFSGPCQNSGGYSNVQTTGSSIGRCSVTVVDRSLYDACVSAALSAEVSIAEACKLSRNGTTWGRWKNSAVSCEIILR